MRCFIKNIELFSRNPCARTLFMKWTFEIGPRTFVLDKALAAEVLAGKKIINGKISEAFNLLPLRYPWSYDLYVELKKANWGPYGKEITELVPTDISHAESPADRGFIETAVGFLAPRGACPESRINDTIREKVTAPELKLVLGRRPQEENIGSDCFLFLSDRLRLDPALCSRGFLTAPSVRQIFDFHAKVAETIHRSMHLESPEDQRKLARAVFFLGACCKGVQFRSLHASMTDFGRSGRFPALAATYRNRHRDEDRHVEFLRRLFLELLKENPGIRGTDFDADLRALMGETVSLERNFIREFFAEESDPARVEQLDAIVGYVARRRLADFELGGGLRGTVENPPADSGETRFAADFPDLDKSSLIDSNDSDDEL